MQEDLYTKKTIESLEKKDKQLKHLKSQIKELTERESKYSKHIDLYEQENKMNSFRMSVVTLYWLAMTTFCFFTMKFTAGSGPYPLVVAISIITMIGIPSLSYIMSKGLRRQSINQILLKPLEKPPLTKKTKVTKKLRHNTLEEIKREKKEIFEEVERLNHSCMAIEFDMQLYEDKLRGDFRQISTSEKKRSPISNLDIRTRNALLSGEKKDFIDNSRVEAIQFVKRK